MHRRTNKINGWVRFPVDRFPNSGEGGTFVRLVVETPRRDEPDSQWMMCCGGTQGFIMDETYIGDDNRPHPRDDDYEIENQEMKTYQAYHFPQIHNNDLKNAMDQYRSIEYLAVITLGSTGWSGCIDNNGTPWIATYADLTPEGQALYDSIQTLYPGHRLTLQTWLDT